jgi:hypothetical protein
VVLPKLLRNAQVCDFKPSAFDDWGRRHDLESHEGLPSLGGGALVLGKPYRGRALTGKLLVDLLYIDHHIPPVKRDDIHQGVKYCARSSLDIVLWDEGVGLGQAILTVDEPPRSSLW